MWPANRRQWAAFFVVQWSLVTVAVVTLAIVTGLTRPDDLVTAVVLPASAIAVVVAAATLAIPLLLLPSRFRARRMRRETSRLIADVSVTPSLRRAIERDGVGAPVRGLAMALSVDDAGMRFCDRHSKPLLSIPWAGTELTLVRREVKGIDATSLQIRRSDSLEVTVGLLSPRLFATLPASAAEAAHIFSRIQKAQDEARSRPPGGSPSQG